MIFMKDALLRYSTKYRFFRFLLVGGAAFLVDYTLLEFLMLAGLSSPWARTFSLAIALQFSYFAQGAFTYHGHAGYSIRQWLRFIGSNLLGAFINYAIFMLAITHAPLYNTHIKNLVGLVAGTTIALGFNYWANQRFVFHRKAP